MSKLLFEKIISVLAFRRARIFSLVALIWLLGASAVKVGAQTYLQNMGVPPFTTMIPVESGFVNAANGNLHLEIPLGSYPQRGGRVDKVALMYDSAIWSPASGVWSPPDTLNFAVAPVGGSGWRLVTSGDPGMLNYAFVQSGYCATEDDYYYETDGPFIWSAPDGTQHTFPVTIKEPLYTVGDCSSGGTPSASGFASDGSGYFISITNYENSIVIFAPDGTVPGSFTGSVPDFNGNLYLNQLNLVGSTWHMDDYDTLNRNIVDSSTSTDGKTYYYVMGNAEGGTSTYTVKLGTVNVSTGFGQSGVGEYSGSFLGVTEIDLPDGSKYQFAYDSGTTSGHYGLLTNMWTPDNGEVIYTYSNSADAYGNSARWITSRKTPDGTTAWSYGGPSVVSNCTSAQVDCQQKVTVTKPSGDNMVYTFTLNGGAWLTEEQIYTGSISTANLLSTTTACYTFVTVTNGQCSYSLTTASPRRQCS